MSLKNRSRIAVFFLSLLVWFMLTDITDLQEVILGTIVAIFVSLVAGHFLMITEKRQHIFRRIGYSLLYIVKFTWEIIKANVHVAYLVAHPKVPINPGIVKIKTKLTKESAITILANSITLTPGTLTVDINPEKQELYIHCIDVHSKKIEDNTKDIGNRFEKILMEIFE